MAYTSEFGPPLDVALPTSADRSGQAARGEGESTSPLKVDTSPYLASKKTRIFVGLRVDAGGHGLVYTASQY